MIGPGLSAEPVLDDLAAYTEHQIKKQLEGLILYYQERELVRSSVNVTDAATIIFFIFNQHFIEYITHADADYEQMTRQMDRQISFIVSALLY